MLRLEVAAHRKASAGTPAAQSGDDNVTQRVDARHHRDRPRSGFGLSPRLRPIGGHWRRQLAATPSRAARPRTKNSTQGCGDVRAFVVTPRGQRLLRSGLRRRDRRRQPDRRQGPPPRLRVADRRPRARDRDPEPDRPGSDVDGLILPPQVGAYNDIVKTAEQKGIPVATTNSFDGTIYNRSGISHTGQDASAAAIMARRSSTA